MTLKERLKTLYLFLMNRDDDYVRHVPEDVNDILVALFSLLPFILAIYGFYFWFTNPLGLLGLLIYLGAIISGEFYVLKVLTRGKE